MDKIYKGKLHNWQVHTLVYDMDKITQLYPELEGKELSVVTGTVTDDPTGKRSDYDHCRTSLVLTIDRENGKLVTLSSEYDLGLEGNDVVGGDLGNSVMTLFY